MAPTIHRKWLYHRISTTSTNQPHRFVSVPVTIWLSVLYRIRMVNWPRSSFRDLSHELKKGDLMVLLVGKNPLSPSLKLEVTLVGSLLTQKVGLHLFLNLRWYMSKFLKDLSPSSLPLGDRLVTVLHHGPSVRSSRSLTFSQVS